MTVRRFPVWLCLASALALAASACTKKEEAPAAATQAQTQGQPAQQAATTQQGGANVTELKIEDMKVGSGAEAVSGKTVEVHYTGWLTNGQKFDSSLDRNQTFKFALGAGQVIAGWDKGVAGMKVGGKRKLTIPPQMGYGDRGAGGVIPPGATLVFEVELFGVN